MVSLSIWARTGSCLAMDSTASLIARVTRRRSRREVFWSPDGIPLHCNRREDPCPDGKSDGANSRRGEFLELPGNLALGVGKIGAVVAGLDRGSEVAAQGRVLVANLLEAGADILAHHPARALDVRGGSALASADPHRCGQFRAQEIQL